MVEQNNETKTYSTEVSLKIIGRSISACLKNSNLDT